MISFSGSLKIFLLVECCDMRKGFNGLYGLVSSSFGEDPRSGALYVFCNRRHSRIKVFYFDGTGLWVLSKRLERGTFSWPKPGQTDSAKLKLSPEAFAMLSDGVDVYDKKKKRQEEAEKLISKLKRDDWNCVGELSSKGTLARIKEIIYPRTNNGHQAKEGFCWQLDIDKGAGSEDRLVLACKPNDDVTIQQRESGTVKVGTDDYKNIEATLTIRGTFRAIEKYH
jgi:transposase